MANPYCPRCGGALEEGELCVFSGRSASLNWTSRNKVNFWKRTLLGGKKKVFRKRRFSVLWNKTFLEDNPCSAPGDYCPKCRVIFAEIDVREQTSEKFEE